MELAGSEQNKPSVNREFTDEMGQGCVNEIRRRSPANLAHWFHCTTSGETSICRAVCSGSWAGNVNRVEESMASANEVSAQLIPLQRAILPKHHHLGLLRQGVGMEDVCQHSV